MTEKRNEESIPIALPEHRHIELLDSGSLL